MFPHFSKITHGVEYVISMSGMYKFKCHDQ
jgi:hypothetical protein